MIILAIDTSCEQASCALYIDGVITDKKSAEDKKKHSSVLMPMVMGFLSENNLKVSDVDKFAVGCGPGSFTGIRIGIAAVKAMAYAVEKPVAAGKSLDVLANKYDGTVQTVCPMIDARNRQVYTAIYRWTGHYYKPLTDYMGITVDRLADMLKEEDGPVAICGDAHEKYLNFLNGKIPGNRISGDAENKYPKASVLAAMVARGNPLLEFGDATSVLPFYLRESQAERLYDAGK